MSDRPRVLVREPIAEAGVELLRASIDEVGDEDWVVAERKGG